MGTPPNTTKCQWFLKRPRSAARSGMTLLEVMTALSLLVAVSTAFLYSAMATVRLNKMTELEVAGTNVISGQLDALVAASRDNRELAHGAAKGLVLYLRNIKEAVESKPDHPIQVGWDSSTGILTYQFPVPYPGLVAGNVTNVVMPLKDKQYPLARGIMQVYLKEDKVPAQFYSWENLKEAGTAPAANNQFFDMDSDGEKTSDFSNLLTGSVGGVYPGSTLGSLPVTITVRYYTDAKAMNRDFDAIGFKDGSDGSALALTRNYVVNNTAITGIF